MSLQPAALFEFDFFEPLPIQIQVSDAPLTSDAGLLPLRQFDERIGLTKQFSAVLDDPRDPALIEHSFSDMVRMRIFGILAGYEDQNDHDTLRADPVFKLIADRSPADADLASHRLAAPLVGGMAMKIGRGTTMFFETFAQAAVACALGAYLLVGLAVATRRCLGRLGRGEGADLPRLLLEALLWPAALVIGEGEGPHERGQEGAGPAGDRQPGAGGPAGLAGGRCGCSVYEDRPTACRRFEPGSDPRREARDPAGLLV